MKSEKKTTTISQVANILSNKQRIALFAHTHPDGDTIGSSIALALALRKLNKTVGIFCDMPMESKLGVFEEVTEISTSFNGKYDLFVAVDCGDLSRVGDYAGLYCKFAETLTIDHHGGDYFSKYNCLKPYASTCQIVYEIVKELNIEIDEQLATYLYMGLCTDTGNFAHNNTDKACFLMAAELCERGARMEQINRVFFKDISLAETKLLCRALSHMRIYYDGKMALMYLTQADLAEFDLQFNASSFLVQYAINIDTAKIGVCMTEYAPNVYKVSMRGKDFSVRDVCKEFGGGGHVLASACMISGLLEDVIDKIVRVVGYTI
ncbi:MAG: bifunctional oligoribonuclease/PAP phosphatase NrnA [Clostridiales bacterium]|nr:bifunctional oligoribonuclease/PAP phosphatase NrnA [Clostridiales bacterium]